jgi:hypothetical protein
VGALTGRSDRWRTRDLFLSDAETGWELSEPRARDAKGVSSCSPQVVKYLK